MLSENDSKDILILINKMKEILDGYSNSCIFSAITILYSDVLKMSIKPGAEPESIMKVTNNLIMGFGDFIKKEIEKFIKERETNQ